MLSHEDFEIPLEKQLRMRVVLDEIETCNDPTILKAHLKQCTETLVKYQHLLGKILEKQIKAELDKWAIEASTIVEELEHNNDAERK